MFTKKFRQIDNKGSLAGAAEHKIADADYRDFKLMLSEKSPPVQTAAVCHQAAVERRKGPAPEEVPFVIRM